jgi:ribonuclease BN (tRNA processing enzyme)
VLGWPLPAAAEQCGGDGVGLQVLGSGGPELTDGRASSGYLVWQDGRARVLVDMGAGSLLQFERSGAHVEDLDVLLLTHLHVDHSADLPALLKGSFFTDRARHLPVYGPTGNRMMPDTTGFVRALFDGKTGAWRYLGDYLSGDAAYRLESHNVPAGDREQRNIVNRTGLRLFSIPVHHGPVPALAWRVDIGDVVIVFSGDMNGDYHTLERLAAGADLLVAHHAVPEDASGVARNLHMPPSVIGRIAAEADVARLVLSHRMNRTLGREPESEQHIRAHYAGPLNFADDGECFVVREAGEPKR